MPEHVRIRRDLLTIYISALSLYLFTGLPSASGQQGGKGEQKSGNPSKLKVSFLKSQVLPKEPNLPYFPHYSGKYLRFRGGLGSEGLTKGESYQLRYETAEKPEDVLNWYESALKQFGYQISEKKPGRLIALLPDQGIGIVLILQSGIQPGYSPGYKCHFTVRYIKQPTK